MGPKDDSGLSHQEIVESIWNTKQRILKLAELTESDDGDKGGMFSKFAASYSKKILANLQVNVKNIHVRYQAPSPLCYAFGVTLHSLVARTTNEQKTPTIAKENDKVLFKVISLHSLTVYWNQCNFPFPSKGVDLLKVMRETVIIFPYC